MIDATNLDSLIRTIQSNLPTHLLSAKDDVVQVIKSTLVEHFKEWDLVTRDEFEMQEKVLRRTREKLEALEAQIKLLES